MYEYRYSIITHYSRLDREITESVIHNMRTYNVQYMPVWAVDNIISSRDKDFGGRDTPCERITGKRVTL